MNRSTASLDRLVDSVVSTFTANNLPHLVSSDSVARPTPPRIERVLVPGEIPRIVVVEDDASMGQAIERILRAGGLAAVTFGSAEAALEAEAATTTDCPSRFPGARCWIPSPRRYGPIDP